MHYDQVVFSGGGTRCFWHGGFMEVLAKRGPLKPARISSVSGGALSAASWIADRERELMEIMGEAFDANGSNVDLAENNYTPHQEIYRQVVSDTLRREDIEAIADGPHFQVLLGHPPQNLPEKAGAALAVSLYELDQQVRSTPHLKLTEAAGIEGNLVDAKRAAREGRLIDLICAAATIPPVFDTPEWDGRTVVDGGTVDKAPVPDPDEGTTLLLLTRIYRNLPDIEGRTYLQPSEPVEADKIDFTDRSKIEETWALGRRDAEAWLDGRTSAQRLTERSRPPPAVPRRPGG